MTNKKITRRALLSSVISLLVCFTMLVGTTFAWFTDSVTSSGNVIKSGTLDVQMFWAKGSEDPASTATVWNDAESTKVFDYDLWEPGYTEARHIKVFNNGSLALKYQLKIIPDGEIGELANVIDVYYTANAAAVSDRDVSAMTKLGTLTEVIKSAISTTVTGTLETKKEAVFTFVLKMQDSAGNDYQDKSVGDTFSFKLIATQATVEGDSFGPDYDADAEYPSSTSPEYTFPTDGFKPLSLVTDDANPSSVSGSAALSQSIAESGATKATLSVSEPKVEGNVVSFAQVALLDQNGNEIDLSGNTEPMTVKLYVGTAHAGKNVSVKHDGEIIATATVDAEGYVTYTATHFCEVTVTFLAEAIAPSVGNSTTIVTPEGDIVGGEEADEVIGALDKTALVQILVGKNFYTVSAGMADSWYENPAIKGQVTAEVYLPEDLLAYSMMYKNGDLDDNPAGNGSHSDLTLMNDLDFADKTFEPIGRFYTNIHGESHKISNLSDSLFGCVYDCQLYDLTLENVTASGSAAGVIAKELAGDVFAENVTIAGVNTVSYVADSKDNWPEGGTGVGAICGISLIGYSGHGNVDVTVTGSITVNYNGATFGNTTNLENLPASTEFGLNVYAANANAKVTLADGGSITATGDYSIRLTDGVIVNSDNTEYSIYNANGLYWFAGEVNKYSNYEHPFEGNTVKLENDIDLGGAEWIPIGDYRFSANRFCGTFDGQGHSVSNFRITKKTDKDDSNKSSYGFFGNMEGTVKNLTIENASICSYAYVGALVGRLSGGMIDNCHVKNCTVETTYWQAGGMIGQANESITVKNSTITGSTVTGASAIGGLIGPLTVTAEKATALIENCGVINCEVVQKGSFGASYDEMFGSVFGYIEASSENSASVKVNKCYVNNTSVKGDLDYPMANSVDGDLFIDGNRYIANGLTQNDETKEYFVYNGAGLAYLNGMMASKTAGKNTEVNLIADVDMTGKVWTPVDSHADTAFSLAKINGNGHTVKNLTVNGQAMFTRFAGSGEVTVTIKDITFDGASVNSNGKINTAILTVQSYQNVLLDNVDVKNSTISGGYKVAPLIATVYNENASTITATLKNCDVSDTTVKASSYDFCTTGMVAFVYADDNDKIEFENCTVSNVKLYAPNDSYKAHAAIYTTGSESLYNEAEGVTVTNCTFESN